MNYLSFIGEVVWSWALRKKQKTVVVCSHKFMESSDLTYYKLVYAMNMAEVGTFSSFCKNKERKKGKNMSLEPFYLFHILAKVKQLSLRLFSFHFLHFAKSFDKTIFTPR